MEYEEQCYQHGEVFECSNCTILVCAECELIRIGGPDIDYAPVECHSCGAKTIPFEEKTTKELGNG